MITFHVYKSFSLFSYFFLFVFRLVIYILY